MNTQNFYLLLKMNFKRIFTTSFVFLSVIIFLIPFFAFGIIIGAYYSYSASLFIAIFILSSITSVLENDIKGTYLGSVINAGKNKSFKLISAITIYFIMLIWTMLLSTLLLLVFPLFYRPGGMFSSLMNNGGNTAGFLIKEFFWSNLIYSVFIEFTIYYLFTRFLIKYVRDKRVFFTITTTIVIFSLFFQSAIYMPFRAVNDDYGLAIFKNKSWMALDSSGFNKVLTLVNPQTHISNFQQALIYQSIYEVGKNGELLTKQPLGINILNFRGCKEWSLTIAIPLIYIFGLSIINLIISIMIKR